MHRLHLLPRDDEAAAEKALAQMFDMADVNHDGTVSFDEFCRMFHQHVGAPSAAKPASHATQEVTAAFAAK
jgi:Ca2+-binding EF-hand superfamily protein